MRRDGRDLVSVGSGSDNENKLLSLAKCTIFNSFTVSAVGCPIGI